MNVSQIDSFNSPVNGSIPHPPPLRRHDLPKPTFEQVLQDKDTDGDGVLSIDEVNISDDAYAKLDANEDSVIDQDEFKSALRMSRDHLKADTHKGMKGMRPEMGPPPGSVQHGMPPPSGGGPPGMGPPPGSAPPQTHGQDFRMSESQSAYREALGELLSSISSFNVFAETTDTDTFENEIDLIS